MTPSGRGGLAAGLAGALILSSCARSSVERAPRAVEAPTRREAGARPASTRREAAKRPASTLAGQPPRARAPDGAALARAFGPARPVGAGGADREDARGPAARSPETDAVNTRQSAKREALELPSRDREAPRKKARRESRREKKRARRRRRGAPETDGAPARERAGGAPRPEAEEAPRGAALRARPARAGAPGTAVAPRPRRLLARTSRLAPPRARDPAAGEALALVALRLGARVGASGLRARVVVDHVFENTAAAPRAPRLVTPLPAGAEPAGLYVYAPGARATERDLFGGPSVESVGPPPRGAWSAPREAQARLRPEAERPGPDPGRLEAIGPQLVAKLPPVPGGRRIRVAVAYTLALAPVEGGFRLELPVPDVAPSARLTRELAVDARSVEVNRGPPGRRGAAWPEAPVPPGSRVALEVAPRDGQPVARGRYDAATDAVLAVIRPPPGAAPAPPAPRPESALVVVEAAAGADRAARARAVERLLSGPGAPARFALLVHDVEAAWLPAPGYRANTPAARRAAADALLAWPADGAASFAAVGRAVTEASSWLFERSPRAYWLTDRAPTWGSADPARWLARFPALARLAFSGPAEVEAARGLARRTGGAVVARGAWASAGSRALVDVEVPGALERAVRVEHDGQGPVVWVAARVPRDEATEVRLRGPGGEVALRLPVAPRGRDPMVARAFAELDTQARGPREAGVRARCARFRIPCAGMVLTLARGPAPAAPPSPRLPPALARALERTRRTMRPVALVSRPAPASERRAVLERRARRPAPGSRLLLELARSRAREGDTLGAVRALSRLVHRRPDDAEVARLVGYGLLALGQLRYARELLEGALHLRPFEARSHLEAGLARELAGDAVGAARAYETVLAGPWAGDEAPARAAAADRYRRLLARVPGAAAGARRARLGPGTDRAFALHWSSPRLDLDLWVLEPDGGRCEPGQATPLGGRSPWDVEDARGPEMYHPPGRSGRYDALVASAEGARRGLSRGPVGALFVVDGAGPGPRLRARWIPGPGLVATLASEDL